MCTATEIVIMKTMEGISKDKFIIIVDGLEKISIQNNPALSTRNYSIMTKLVSGLWYNIGLQWMI